jgi:hypothetical protein
MRSSFAGRRLPVSLQRRLSYADSARKLSLGHVVHPPEIALADRGFGQPFSIGFPFFTRLRGDIDRRELNQPFAAVQSERFGRQSLPLRQSVAFPRKNLARSQPDLVCSRVLVEAFRIKQSRISFSFGSAGCFWFSSSTRMALDREDQGDEIRC